IEDNSGETICPKSPRKYICYQNKISELFIDFVVSNIESFSIADDTKFRNNGNNKKNILCMCTLEMIEDGSSQYS
ncbi:hypothetical protein BpHYR1_021982, partial [Brachionus plicatilis]